MRAIIHITRPELTPEEREHRMAAIKKAAVALIVATEKEGKRHAKKEN